MTSLVTKLSDEEVRARLLQIPTWKLNRGELECTFSLTSFPQAVLFVDAVALLAESEQHHPDITITYDTVILRVATHSAGGISEKDFMLAQRISQLERVFQIIK
ncbi:putative pterin-4-alpha-carbinolamine dehydratase [Dictyobacter arantiisoli]|uniref:Putative pterin-4-alpha-carbinolamine dehydratase n=2 Tax=Dictyobacter arantiisoli TaxID=2014874 RepID=A0A5A5TDB8_9CHLR|nr:putative pterin-4-alpha-carbinolamine dehydratase [Dictyobacter arantiisoli]